MTEKRHALRQKSFLRGFVYFGNSPSAFDCLVRDISDTGARLKFSGPPAYTEMLDLHIPVKGQSFRSKVQWHTGDEIGIVFDGSAATDADANMGDVDLASRVHRLEAEIAALKQLVKRLQKNTDHKTEAA